MVKRTWWILLLVVSGISGDRVEFSDASFRHEWSVALEDLEIYKRPKISVGADGTICLGDRDNKQLVFVNARGELLSRLGREGKGPAEFGAISSMGYLKEKNVFWVCDIQNGRLSFWREQGMVSEHANLGEWAIDNNAAPILFGEENVFFLTGNKGCKGLPITLKKKDFKNGTEEVFLNLPPFKRDVGLHQHEGDSNIMGRFLWDVDYMVAADEKIICVLNSDETHFTITDHTKAENNAKKVNFSFPRPPVSDSDFDDEVNTLPSFMLEEIRSSITRPEYWPSASLLIMDNQRNIWLFGHALQKKAERPILIFNEKGEAIKSGSISFAPSAIADSFAYELQEDEDAGFKLKKHKFKLE